MLSQRNTELQTHASCISPGGLFFFFPGNQEADMLPLLQRPPRGTPTCGQLGEDVGGGSGGNQNEPQLGRHSLRPPAPPVCTGWGTSGVFGGATFSCWCREAWALVGSKGVPSYDSTGGVRVDVMIVGNRSCFEEGITVPN